MLCWTISCCLTVLITTTVGMCRKQAVLCELCTVMCGSVENSRRFVKAHTMLCHPVPVCATVRPKDIRFQTKHVCGNYCSVQQCLTGARGSKMVGAALRMWHTLIIHLILQTQTHMPKCIERCSVSCNASSHRWTRWHQRGTCALHRHAHCGVDFCIMGA